MKFLRSSISLLNKSQLNAGILGFNRRFCDKKTKIIDVKLANEPKTEQNVDTANETPTHSAIRNDFEHGITISSYSIVCVAFYLFFYVCYA